jgi:hypothetical protein
MAKLIRRRWVTRKHGGRPTWTSGTTDFPIDAIGSGGGNVDVSEVLNRIDEVASVLQELIDVAANKSDLDALATDVAGSLADLQSQVDANVQWVYEALGSGLADLQSQVNVKVGQDSLNALTT